jgi:pyroglutamyl-peptidase
MRLQLNEWSDRWSVSGARAVVWFVAAWLVCGRAVGGAEEPPAVQPTTTPAAITATARPVILLTGFEPFGRKRHPNPSWEGIKALDGQTWNEFQLVARQMQVVWGAPLEQLRDWTAEVHPVAVFSFGEGGKESFTIETSAENVRRADLDNTGQHALRSTIVHRGPEELTASVDCQRVAKALADKGYPIRVSRRAGHYLCEETLYSLEYLKSTRHRDMGVMFCHVPPLGSEINGRVITADYVQQFAKDVLSAWHLLYQQNALAPPAEAKTVAAADTKTVAVADAKADPASDDPRQAEVKQFVEGYFSSWSNQEMDRYSDCFLPDAAIQFIDAKGELWTYARTKFVAKQRDYQRRAETRAIEVPESIDIRFESKLARAVVYWKLTAGTRVDYGYDHFTLVKYRGKWRIVNLTYYGVNRPE